MKEVRNNACNCCKKAKTVEASPQQAEKDERCSDHHPHQHRGVLFAFPLYWIITGSFKTQVAINATTPEWWPSEWVLTNYQKLFSREERPAVAAGRALQQQLQRGRRAHLLLGRPHRSRCHPLDDQHRVYGRCVHDPDLHHRRHGRLCAGQKALCGPQLLFTLIVCAMALPKQVILIPLLREMSA